MSILSHRDPLLTNITDYWDNRALSYSSDNQKELNSKKHTIWQQLILSHAPAAKKLNILDIGTGPGFFSIIMAQAGHKVTSIDATDEMLKEARKNAQNAHVTIDFIRADAHYLPFESNIFDVVMSRNVSWNLAAPIQAYREWHRVLAPQGRLINFDANWYLHLYNDTFRTGFEHDRLTTAKLNIPDHYVNTDTVSMTEIALALPLSRELRPQWDATTLLDIGFSQCFIDTQVWKQVWNDEEKINYKSTPMFMIVAEK